MEQTKSKSFLERGRVSPRDVLEAYERTGIAEARIWWDTVHVPEHNCTYEMGCGLTAIAGAKAIEADRPFVPGLLDDLEVGDYITNIIGLDEDYVIGFIGGFDGDPREEIKIERERIGDRDGRRAARFVFGDEEANE